MRIQNDKRRSSSGNSIRPKLGWTSILGTQGRLGGPKSKIFLRHCDDILNSAGAMPLQERLDYRSSIVVPGKSKKSAFCFGMLPDRRIAARYDMIAAERRLMSDVIYCKAIIEGMRARGWSHADILSFSGLGDAEITAVLDGKHSFSDDVIVRIEHSTGLTAGQLAVGSAQDVPASLVELMNGWAKARSTAPATQSTASS